MLDELRAEVARNTTVTASLIALVRGLADRLDEHQNNPAEIAALAAELRTNTDSMVAAVEENTVPEPPAPTE